MRLSRNSVYKLYIEPLGPLRFERNPWSAENNKFTNYRMFLCRQFMHLVFSVNQPVHIGCFPAIAHGVWSALELESRVRELPPLDNRLAHLDAAADITHVLGHFTLWPRAVTMNLWGPSKLTWRPYHENFNFVWSRAFKCSVKTYANGFSTECSFINHPIHVDPSTW